MEFFKIKKNLYYWFNLKKNFLYKKENRTSDVLEA